MAYIIITRKQFDTTGPRPLDHPADTEHAVATLDEARDAGWQAMAGVDRYGLQEAATLSAQVHDLPESGGTIGPLPDGTVIEIRRIDWHEITGRLPDSVNRESATAILGAFNAR